MFSISNQEEFDAILKELIQNTEKRILSGNNNLQYIKKNKGAVTTIVRYLGL
jgi:3-deoxy-D-manno-octulosonic-acid transferase